MTAKESRISSDGQDTFDRKTAAKTPGKNIGPRNDLGHPLNDLFSIQNIE